MDKPSTTTSDSSPHPPLRSPKKTFTLVALIPSVILVGVLFLITKWHFYWVWAVSLSLTTFLMYGLDKFQAWRGKVRVPEIVLHGLSLVGGVPGGWAGSLLFRHKKHKILFQSVLVISTILHGALVYYLFFGRR